jgi:hypothetical protein
MVRAKFKITNVELYESPVGSGRVVLKPVYKYEAGVTGNACKENQSFWEATPSGEISLSITNPAGFKPFVDAFHAKKPMYVDFTEAPE